MSVLIKGMKMPKNCKECPFCKWSNHYQIYVCFDGTRYTEIFFDGKHPTESALRSRRADNCPMTELPPHGRLIDGDVAEVITYTDEDGTFADGILYAADWIASQPTVIEADDTIKTPLFDIVEEHDHCHVQVLRNSITGEVSVGWWEEKE